MKPACRTVRELTDGRLGSPRLAEVVLVPDLDRIRSALGSRFELGEVVGRGGMATVYRAYDSKHGRDVAIKVVEPDAAVALDRFFREVEATAALQHPNIVPLYDSGEEDGVLFYVMPFIAGETLRDRLEREPQLPLDDAVHITREVAAALQYAHDRGVVHRDVKPSNVLLSEGKAVLADFGVAALQSGEGERLTRSGYLVGTPSYVSPEQAGEGHQSDARSDQYSLACVVFEMLTGQPPFLGMEPRVVVAQHLAQQPPSLTVLRPAATRAMDSAVARALSKVPADRFPTVTDFAEALTTEPEHPGTRSRRLARSAAIGIAVLAAWALIVWGGGPRSDAASLNPDEVIVFPFSDRGGAGTELGAEIALVIGMALEHTDPLRFLDGWELMTAEQRRDPGVVDGRTERSIAVEGGAGHYIGGNVLIRRDSVSVSIRLHRTDSGEILDREIAQSATTDATPEQVALEATIRLLPALVDPGRTIDLTPITDRDPTAITLWMQGERDYRLSRFRGALEFYRRAVDLDPAFSFAAIKGAQAAAWIEDLDEATRLADVALEHASSLPRKYESLAEGLARYLHGDADEAVRVLNATIDMDPGWAEPWTALGEVYRHLLPTDLQVHASARDAFERSVHLDPDFLPPAYHLAEAALLDQDRTSWEPLLEDLKGAAADPEFVGTLEYLRGCRDGEHDQWAIREPADTLALLLAGKTLAGRPWGAECAERAFRSLMDHEGVTGDFVWGSTIGLYSLLVARGRTAEAMDLVDRYVASTGAVSATGLLILGAIAGAGHDDVAESIAQSAAVGLGRDYGGARFASSQYLFGAWHAYRGNIERLAGIRASMEAKAARDPTSDFGIYAEALEAHEARLVGPSQEAIRLLERLRVRGDRYELEWDLAAPLWYERLALARLLLDAGEPERALRIAEGFEHLQPMVFVALLRPSLDIRIRAAEALNDPDLAAEYVTRLEALAPPEQTS